MCATRTRDLYAALVRAYSPWERATTCPCGSPGSTKQITPVSCVQGVFKNSFARLHRHTTKNWRHALGYLNDNSYATLRSPSKSNIRRMHSCTLIPKRLSEPSMTSKQSCATIFQPPLPRAAQEWSLRPTITRPRSQKYMKTYMFVTFWGRVIVA